MYKKYSEPVKSDSEYKIESYHDEYTFNYGDKYLSIINEIIFNITNYLNVILLVIFIIIYMYDVLVRSNSKLKSSFFIISFVNIVLNLYWRGFFLLTSIIVVNNKALILFDIGGKVGFIFEGIVILLLSINRYVAIKYPFRYKCVCSNKTTIIVLAMILVILFIYSTLKQLLRSSIISLEVILILDTAEQFFNVISSLISLYLTLSIINFKKNNNQNSIVIKQEKKLLFMALYLTVLHVFIDTKEIIYRFLPEDIYNSFGNIFWFIHDLITILAVFGLFGGMIIVLFINRYVYNYPKNNNIVNSLVQLFVKLIMTFHLSGVASNASSTNQQMSKKQYLSKQSITKFILKKLTQLILFESHYHNNLNNTL